MSSTTSIDLSTLAPIDVQAGTTYSQEILSRLIESLQSVNQALNQIVAAVNELAADGGGTTVPVHELAGESGLGPAHEVSGLVPGNVLVATATDSAEFSQLKLQQLAQMDASVAEPTQGDALVFTDGYWTPVPITDDNPDTTQTYLTVGNESATLPNSKQLAPGSGVTLTAVGKTLVIAAETSTIAGPIGTVLTGRGTGAPAAFQYPPDMGYTTFAGAA